MSRLWLILPISLLLTACGYHTDDPEQTISISYFRGDRNGLLTDVVIRALSSSGAFRYTNRGGHLLLEGTLLSAVDEQIGYQFDRNASGQRENRLVPNEGRKKITVQITLTDTRTQKIVYGPVAISAYGDYDFIDSDSKRETSFGSPEERESSLFFSLGQLDSIDGAKKTSLDPIHRRLALKIVEGISNLTYNDK